MEQGDIMTVKIAGAPISWGVCEVPGWGHQMTPARVLEEMASMGLAATEFGPEGFLPDDPADKVALLATHNMVAVGGFVPIVLHDKDVDPLVHIEKERESFVAAGANVLVLAAATGIEGYDAPRPQLTDEQWAVMFENLTRISSYAAEQNITAVIHPHAGTMVETKADIERVLAGTDIPFCLDTGHFWIGGTDPVAFVAQHHDRIGHVHFKDVHLDVAQRVKDGELTYYQAVTQGLYAPLGDGDVDVRTIISDLVSNGYDGWFVLEQDNVITEEPASGDGPYAEARRSAEYLRRVAAEVVGA
jgi:inosose dehydratase